MLLMGMVISGCGMTDVKHVQYQQVQRQDIQPVPPSMSSIAVGNFTDQRTAAYPTMLCEVRNGFNVVLKHVDADQPVSNIVRTGFLQALSARGVNVSATAPYEVNGTIDGLGCIYKLNKLFTANLTVSVVTIPDRRVVFQQKYTTQHIEQGAGAGILADTDALVLSEEQTIGQTIDKVLADPNFLSAASGSVAPPTSPDEARPVAVDARLKKLDDLRKQGLISEAEYQAKRKAVLDTL